MGHSPRGAFLVAGCALLLVCGCAQDPAEEPLLTERILFSIDSINDFRRMLPDKAEITIFYSKVAGDYVAGVEDFSFAKPDLQVPKSGLMRIYVGETGENTTIEAKVGDRTVWTYKSNLERDVVSPVISFTQSEKEAGTTAFSISFKGSVFGSRGMIIVATGKEKEKRPLALYAVGRPK